MKMTKKCILHGGMPKTGSTSIQEAFFEFTSSDLVYAPLILGNHTFALEYLFNPKGKERLKALPARRLPKHFHRRVQGLAERFEAFLKSNTRSVLISSEALVGPRLLDNRDALVDFLKPYFDEIEFVAYLRAPDDYMVSSMQQTLQSSESYFDLKHFYPHYRESFEPWVETLGAANVSLIEYAPSRLNGGNVVSDFAARLGVSVIGANNEQSNTAQSAEAIATQQLWNRRLNEADLSFYQRAKISFGRREVIKFGKHNFGVEPKLLQSICKENQEDIAWAEEMLGKLFVPYKPKPKAILFDSEEYFLDFAKSAEKSFWSYVSDTWSWRRHSVPLIEAVGRTLVNEE
jgi:hypothetical protein